MIEKTEWRPIPFLQDDNLENCIPYGLESVWLERPQVVLESGRSGTWDEFGVRDPALLVDECGYLVREEDALVLYYTGSYNKGFWQAAGRALSYDEGLTWQRYPETPVIAPKEGAWDSSIAATPWVLRDADGLYRLYYRGGSSIYQNAVGLAVSEDGINFERVGFNPILAPDDFADLPREGKVIMGVMNAVRMLDGRYLITFEAPSMSFACNTQIFGAISDDGEHFHPLNNGYPVFSAKHVRSWPVRRVANPRITVFEESGTYMLAFNACSDSGFYAIGLAFTRDLKDWWEHPGNPLISPTGSPVDDPFSGRLEGAVFVKEDLKRNTGPVRVFLMGIPRRGPSHKGGVIGLTRGWLGDPRSQYTFHAMSAQPSDVVIAPLRDEDGETLYLRQSASSAFPARVHFSTLRWGAGTGVLLELLLESSSEGSALLFLGKEMGSILLTEGIGLGFSRGQLNLWAGWHRKSLLGRLHNRLVSYLAWWPWLGWYRLGLCEQGVWHRIHVVRKGVQWIVQLSDRHLVSIPVARLGMLDFYDITIQSAGQPIRVRNLRLKIAPETTPGQM